MLLNKTDLVSAAEVARVEARIAGINPYATLHRTQRCNVDLGDILAKDAFKLDRILEFEPGFLTEAHAHEHDDHIASLSLTTDRPIDPARSCLGSRM